MDDHHSPIQGGQQLLLEDVLSLLEMGLLFRHLARSGSQEPLRYLISGSFAIMSDGVKGSIPTPSPQRTMSERLETRDPTIVDVILPEKTD